MKLSEPLGNTLVAPLLVRIPLGVYLIMTGRAKLDAAKGLVNPEFVAQIQNSKVMHHQVATLYAILLPYLEIFAGGLVLFGFWITLAGALSALIICSYIYLSGVYPVDAKGVVSKDILALGASLSLMYSSAGFLSVDRFRKGGGPP